MKKPKIQVLRILTQIICFILIPGLFIEAYNGVKFAMLAIVEKNATFEGLSVQILPTCLLILATLILGRFFCGWMCGFGTLGDFMYFIGNKIFHINIKVNRTADKVMKLLKYVVLMLSLVVVAIFDSSPLSKISPWDAFGMLYAFPPAFSYAFTYLTIGTILLIIIMIGSLFIERFFCRYFCPMGAIFNIVSLVRLARIKKPKKNCGKCILCTRKCAMGIPLYEKDMVDSGECINCMKCVTICPRQNVSFSVIGKVVAPAVTTIAVALVIGLYYAGNVGVNAYTQSIVTENLIVSEENTEDQLESESNIEQSIEQSEEIAEPSTNTSLYVDGTYQGSGIGFKGRTTTVSIVIENGQITDIQSVSTGDDKQYFNKAFSTIVSEIVDKQSSAVDSVSGATYSSKGIISAVEDALSKASE